MTIKHLQVFVKVCKCMNMTRAAELLNMTQPAVTRSIKELEQYYNVKLFERLNKRIYLTEIGKDMYAKAVHILSNFDEMETDLLEEGKPRILRVGSSFNLGAYYLPELIASFSREYPKVKIQVKVYNNQRLIHMIEENELDLAFVEDSILSSDLSGEVFRRDQMILVYAPDHPIGCLEHLKVSDLNDYPLLCREEGSAARRWLDNIFMSHGMKLSPAWESVSTEAMVHAARCGLGITILPEDTVQAYLNNGMLESRKVEDERFERDNMIIWHKDKFFSKEAKDLIAFTRRFNHQYVTQASERQEKHFDKNINTKDAKVIEFESI